MPDLTIPFAKNHLNEIEFVQLTGTETPHTLVAGGTQTGKTTVIRLLGAMSAAKGAIVLVLDPKYRWKKIFKGLPNIIVYDDPEEWHTVIIAAIREMKRRYLIDQASDDDLLSDDMRFPTLVIVADEFATLLIQSDAWWKKQPDEDDPTKKNKGKAPIRDGWTTLLLQGAESRVILAAATQQANRDVFPNGTQDRGQYGQRIGLGIDLEPSSWQMLAGRGVEKPIVAAKRRGAGAYIRGGSVVPVQCAKVDRDELRTLARRGLAKLRAAGYLDPSGCLTLHDHPDVRLPRPAEIIAPVPDGGTPVSHRTVAVLHALEGSPGGDSGALSGEVDSARVIGNAAAATYLNRSEKPRDRYTPDGFRKARQRRPVPGEERVSGQPSWTRLALRTWHRNRPIAGNRKESS